MENIFDENNLTHINYLSIDVEGAEFEVIKSINFDKIFIDVIAFENNYDDKSIPIVEYLGGKGYIFIYKIIDIFMIHVNSKFNIVKLLPVVGPNLNVFILFFIIILF